jgi:hypothetical protein
MDVLKDFRDTDKGSERLSNLHVYRWAGCTALRQHLYCSSMISVEVGLCPESVHCNVLHWQCSAGRGAHWDKLLQLLGVQLLGVLILIKGLVGAAAAALMSGLHRHCWGALQVVLLRCV